MCRKLTRNGQIIVPGDKLNLKPGDSNLLTWGLDLGYGLIANAKIESIEQKKWEKWKMNKIGQLYVDGFFEFDVKGKKSVKFNFEKLTPISILHNDSNFLVITKPSIGIVKKTHSRQPCFNLN